MNVLSRILYFKRWTELFFLKIRWHLLSFAFIRNQHSFTHLQEDKILETRHHFVENILFIIHNIFFHFDHFLQNVSFAKEREKSNIVNLEREIGNCVKGECYSGTFNKYHLPSWKTHLPLEVNPKNQFLPRSLRTWMIKQCTWKRSHQKGRKGRWGQEKKGG